MKGRFPTRTDAGKQLARALMAYKGDKDALVLALPRGGVPIGAEIAKVLGLPMDLMLVRKLGVPGQEELAMGAVAAGGVCFLNDDLIRQAGLTREDIDGAIARESSELDRRNRIYRGGRPFPNLNNRTVILVDDGVATGADMRAAVQAARELGAKKIIVAVPVAAAPSLHALENEADETISLLVPEVFFGVGAFYDDFSQMEDEEVLAIMAGLR